MSKTCEILTNINILTFLISELFNEDKVSILGSVDSLGNHSDMFTVNTGILYGR